MKKNKMFTVFTVLGFAALLSCNNTSDATTGNEDTSSANGTVTNNTSTADNTAYADEIEKSSTEGYYLNPRTGKSYSKLNVNRNTGEISDQNNEPVWRYVDKRNWWVYGVDDDWNWIKLGEAKMDNDQLLYKDDQGSWVTYDKRWSSNDETLTKSWKAKSGNAKIKFDKDGDVKYKDDSTRLKYDADDNKVKKDSSK
jgi:hypothetical protein